MTARDPSTEPPRAQLTLKTVLTACFGVVLVGALLLALSKSVVALTLTVTSLLIAVALNHGVVLLMRRRVPRAAAVVLVIVASLGVLTALGFTLIPPAIDQGEQLVRNSPTLLKQARRARLLRVLDERFHISSRIAHLDDRIPEIVEGAAEPVLTALGGVLSFLAATVTIAFLVLFMLLFGRQLVDAALSEARPDRRGIYERALSDLYNSIGGYFGGLFVICTINATLTTSFLAINRIPFFLPLGILSGFSSMIPYAGPAVVGAFISAVALITVGPWHALAAVIYFVVYGQLEGNVLSPLIFKRTVHVNPLLGLLAIVFLGEMAGITGAILAIPALAAAQIIVREILQVRREQLARSVEGERHGD